MGLCPTLPERKAKMQVAFGNTAIDYLSPSLKHVHEIGIDQPEECLAWMAHTMICYLFVVIAHMPDYFRCLFDSSIDVRGVYRYHHYVLKILQTRYPEPASKHWVLKTPVHLQHLDHLLKEYPDAIVVWNHRKLNQTIPSSCSLLTHFQAVTSQSVDYHSIGELIGQAAPVWLNNAVAVRKQHGDRIYDLQFDDLVKDPIQAMKNIYDRFDLKWDDSVRGAMEAKFKSMPRNKHGEHKYSMEMFGLDEQVITGRCREYVETFYPKGVSKPSPVVPSKSTEDAVAVEDS
jgi:hypothetical protein